MKYEMQKREALRPEQTQDNHYAEDGDGKYHLGPDGQPLYNERYEYVGEFKNNLAVVRDFDRDDAAFHIRKNGTPAYTQRYLSASDYNEGFARVDVNQNGEAYTTFIDQLGEQITELKLIDAHDFEDGKATVQLASGEMAQLSRNGTLIR